MYVCMYVCLYIPFDAEYSFAHHLIIKKQKKNKPIPFLVGVVVYSLRRKCLSSF